MPYNDNILLTPQQALEFKFSDLTWNEFAETIKHNTSTTPYSIIRVCSHVTRSPYHLTMSESRDPRAVFARYLAMYFLKKLSCYNLTHIETGKLVAGRDHCSVTHGLEIVYRVKDQSHYDKYKGWFNDSYKLINDTYDLQAVANKEKVYDHEQWSMLLDGETSERSGARPEERDEPIMAG